MAGRDVNLTISDITATGSNVNFPQYTMSITATWTDTNGQPKSHSETVLFPNILNDAALPNAWLKDKLKNLVIEALRVIHNIDEP